MTQAKEKFQANPEVSNPAYLWLSGKLAPWEQATVHVTQIGWTAISAVFEGIRGYWSQGDSELYLFRLQDHLSRLAMSMKLMRMAPRFSIKEIEDAIVELLQANTLREDAYVMPLAYFSGSIPGYRAVDNHPSELLITARPMASRLDEARESHCCVSSWVRISDNVMPPRAKALANYQNNRLVSTEAQINGYDSGIMLNERGKVAEGAYSCLFIIRGGVAATPPITAGILEGITRDTAITLLESELEVPVAEREIDRTELYIAEEVFLCGTWAEIEPVVSVDRYKVGLGEPGPVTSKLKSLYAEIVRGANPNYSEWRTPVYR